MLKSAFLALLIAVLNLQTAVASPESSARSVRELLKVTDFEKMTEFSVKSTADAYARQTAQPAKARPAIEKFLREYVGPKAIEADVIKTYQKYFNESEIQELTKFYSSPTGQKMSAVQSSLVRDLTVVGESKIQAHRTELKKILNEFRKK